MKAKVERAKTLPPNFRPVHPLDRVPDWEGVRVIVRGQTEGVVRGAVRSGGTVRLFIIIASGSMWVEDKEVERMTENHADEIIHDEEPEGGWVTAPTLLTGEIQSLVLCKYSGERPVEAVLPGSLQCAARTRRLHKDEDCFVFFHSAAALLSGAAVVSTDDLLIAEETVRTGDEITYKNPIT